MCILYQFGLCMFSLSCQDIIDQNVTVFDRLNAPRSCKQCQVLVVLALNPKHDNT